MHQIKRMRSYVWHPIVAIFVGLMLAAWIQSAVRRADGNATRGRIETVEQLRMDNLRIQAELDTIKAEVRVLQRKERLRGE